MKQIGQLRTNVLEIAMKQINEHTELRIDYKLEKRGRTFKNIVFTVKSQATTGPIPFDLDPATTMTLPGVQQTQIDRAAYNLDELRITNSKHRQTILSSAEHVLAVNRFSHDLKTDKIKAKSNPGGLLLTQLGLVAAKAPKPA